ncbi:alpha/beta fold hydrolase [Kineosporia succinea]|uniref:Pimeloyl-ACP methyl ester carboxylesterase n=1 Tax=Kineosporia succinea TaxID=84632 RepID=A0ABT9PCC3_9ACTN|nr:alpha/beta hydrolase [Kineosporia succinea]MDP9829625.1 pimeloyl-ACP methyl ester carboxylesterase [Kineosporia succinea]
MTTTRTIRANGIALNVATAGQGPALLLLHGFPHTWQIWEPVLAALAQRFTVIAPDLRGLGDSERPESGYTAMDVVQDMVALLDVLEVSGTDVVGIDLGTPPAFLLAATHPERVRRLVVMESLIGPLPGAEDFLRGGPPWWFGFHSVPGLAESALAGNEASYLDFFLQAGTLGDGVTPEFRKAVHTAYRGGPALRAAFEHYRAFADSGRQIVRALAASRLRVPTLTIGAAPVGDATYRQLEPVTDTLSGVVLDNCGHIIPQHRPELLLEALNGFLV